MRATCPAAAANYRSNLLRSGNLPDSTLRSLEVPTLLISSAKDRMLPSIAEGEAGSILLPPVVSAMPVSAHVHLTSGFVWVQSVDGVDAVPGGMSVLLRSAISKHKAWGVQQRQYWTQGRSAPHAVACVLYYTLFCDTTR